MSGTPVVLITGAAAGIGAACSRLFAERGWHTVVTDIEIDRARAVVNNLPKSTATELRCDVADAESVAETFSVVERLFGRLDALVNNAGIFRPCPSHLVSEASWNELLNVHLGGTFRVTRGAARLLVQSVTPAIVNVSSVTAARGFPGRLSYNAAKAAVEAVTRTLAVEWGVAGVRVNAVAPGFIATEHALQQYADGVADAASRVSLTALGRLGRSDEVAEAVYWLSSSASSYVTGHVLVVDGGFLAYGATGPDPTFLDEPRLRDSLCGA
jgi:NAD(P)-dependent dehydrogenase (short-subunit alcohol dehydrogenase family)